MCSSVVDQSTAMMVNDTAKGQKELRPLVQIQPHRSLLTSASAQGVVKEQATLFRKGSIPLTCQLL